MMKQSHLPMTVFLYRVISLDKTICYLRHLWSFPIYFPELQATSKLQNLKQFSKWGIYAKPKMIKSNLTRSFSLFQLLEQTFTNQINSCEKNKIQKRRRNCYYVSMYGFFICVNFPMWYFLTSVDDLGDFDDL